jgi:hypothetical protein
MLIIVPWKPVAVVLGLLGALIFVGFFGTAIAHGKDPFSVSTGESQSQALRRDVRQSDRVHKSAPKLATQTSR